MCLGAYCTEIGRVRGLGTPFTFPDNFVKGYAILVLLFHFSKATKSLFTVLVGARARYAWRPRRFRKSVANHTLFCSFVCGSTDKIRIPACPKGINLLHPVKNIETSQKISCYKSGKALTRVAHVLYIERYFMYLH